MALLSLSLSLSLSLMYLSHRPIYYLSPGRVGICRQGLAVRLRCRCRRTRLCVGVLHVGRLFIASFQWMDPILLVDAVSGVVLVRGGPVGTEAVIFQNHPTDQPNVPTHTPSPMVWGSTDNTAKTKESVQSAHALFLSV